MKVILDTNVFASGVFFTGTPHTILNAWHHGWLSLVISPEILEEYRRVVHGLAVEFPAVDPVPPLELVAVHGLMVDAPPLPHQVCADPDDDKFLACAVASQARIVVTGDKALLRTSGYADIEVIPPKAFLDKYLSP